MFKKIVSCLLVFLLVASSGVYLASAFVTSDDVGVIETTYYGRPEDKGPPPGKGGGGGGGDKGYEILRGGVKWNLSDYPDGVPYMLALDGAPVGADVEIVAAFEAWDAETSVEIFGGPVAGSANTVSWAPIATEEVIAQCTIIYNRRSKEIIEFDIVFNSNMPWDIDADGEGTGYTLTDAFDIHNIAIHEIGHTLHLGDLYDSNYSEMTMYGYATLGEVKKISLESGDIAGLHKLYGE
jgi:hypothetical protein